MPCSIPYPASKGDDADDNVNDDDDDVSDDDDDDDIDDDDVKMAEVCHGKWARQLLVVIFVMK